MGFWLDDPLNVLFLDTSKMFEIIPALGADAPTADMDQQLNALMRLSVYFALAMIVFGRSSAAVFGIVVAAGITIVVHQSLQSSSESFGLSQQSGRQCREPVPDNPFMNPMPYDDPTLPGACDVEDPAVRRKMDAYFEQNLFRDVSDVFSSQASDRQYYTLPATTVPNDQTAVARWLYDIGPTCKEQQNRCDIRFKGDVPRGRPRREY